MIITSRMEFDAGHRIPNHKSTCKNLHGHRYAIEVSLSGEIIQQEDQSDYGMVLDFKDAKELIRSTIIDPWDHAFIVYKKDVEVLNFLNQIKDHKTVILDRVPTAENMALIAFQMLVFVVLKLQFVLFVNLTLRLVVHSMHEFVFVIVASLG